MQTQPGRLNKALWAILLALSIITILAGVFFWGDRKYVFIGYTLIIYAIIPFFFKFEASKPSVHELVVIAVLCAITVASRAAFFMVPQFKPMAALVIISGVCFGPQSGFLVGSLSAFISNMFFGQGPWTPWQMFCFGFIGFLAGILFYSHLIKPTRINLCVFGFASVMLIYGGLMNLSSLLMFSSQITLASLLAVYISGFWFDIIHASATAFFLYTLGQNLIKRCERVKDKYGISD